MLGEHFRVIALDLRGRADSEWPDEYSLPLMADDVVKFMDALGILGAVLVGHSSGALVAFLVATGHPDRLRMLVLEEMPPPDAAEAAVRAAARPRPGTVAGTGRPSSPSGAGSTRRTRTGGSWPTG